MCFPRKRGPERRSHCRKFPAEGFWASVGVTGGDSAMVLELVVLRRFPPVPSAGDALGPLGSSPKAAQVACTQMLSAVYHRVSIMAVYAWILARSGKGSREVIVLQPVHEKTRPTGVGLYWGNWKRAGKEEG